MTNTKTKRIIAIALSGAMLLPAISMAEAGPRDGWRDHRGGGDHHRPNRGGHGHKKHNNDLGAAVAAGVIGLAAGAILLGATSQRSYAAPAPAYYPPAPARGPVYGGYQPWSPAWYQYCSGKYRTFDPSTGTYTTYRGAQKFCQ